MTPVADTAGIELAINMTKSCGTNTVWFPPAPGYQLTHTLIIDSHNDGIVLQGSSGAHGWGVDPPLVGISQCACSPSHPCAGNMTQCNFTRKIVILSRFVALSVSLTQKVSLFQCPAAPS